MCEQETLRVMLADNHALALCGLNAFVSAYRDLEFVGRAAYGREAAAIRKAYAGRPTPAPEAAQM